MSTIGLGELDILEPGWQLHKSHNGNFRCATGHKPRNHPPEKPAGIGFASSEAKVRWKEDLFATQVNQYENKYLVWPSTSADAQEAHIRYFTNGGRLLSVLSWKAQWVFPLILLRCSRHLRTAS